MGFLQRRLAAHASARSRGDRGAAMVEMALVVPFLALLVGGIIEFGTLWRDDLTVTSATRSAARVISNAGDAEGADYQGILSLQAALTSMDGATIEGVLVYDASAADGQPNSSCFDGNGDPRSSTNWCNYYSAAQVASISASDFSACTGLDASFCPTSRSTNQAAGVTQIGVWVRVRREYFTGLIPGDGVAITDFTVMNLEPDNS